MIRVRAERVMAEEDALALWRSDTTPVEVDPSLLIGDAPAVIEVDGEPEILVARLPDDALRPLRRALLDFPCGAGVRRSAGIRTRSQVFGFMGRNPVLQRNTCMVSTSAVHHPLAHAQICATARVLAEMLEEHLPARALLGAAAVDPVLPEWRLPGGLWTSGVVNRTSQFPYHRDRNNFDAWSAMPVVRRGIRGGHLHFPELEVNGRPLAVACSDGEVVFFNGQRWMHGVTPMRPAPRARDPYRISAVYYPVAKMASCLPLEEEIRRSGTRRTELEDTLLARQRANGILTD